MKNLLGGICVLFPLLILAPVSIQASTTAPGRSPVITIGQRHTLPSEILGEPVDLILHLPDNYESDAARHPVLLMLGSNYRARFAMAASTLDYMRAQLQLPPIILVGVDLPHGNFGLVPREGADGTAGADRYIEALTREIIPYVDEHFRTNGYRILYGGSNCGIFAIYGLMDGRLPVQAYLASSPMIGWSPELIRTRTRDAVAGADRPNRFLFLIASDDDYGRVTREFPGYVELLKTSAPPWLRWRAELRVNEGHVPEVDLSFGLRALFPDYNPPVELSTLQALREHFAGLSARYGFTLDVPPALLFDVGYERAAEGNLNESRRIFEFTIEHDPKGARGYAGLAFVHQKRGDAAGALALAEKAIELDPRLGLAKRVKNEIATSGPSTPPPAPRTADAPTLAVTYLANSGFMIEGGGKKVLVDALFEPGIPRYAAPSPELADRMIQGVEPFDGVDLLLVTHPHADHFAPDLVVAFLREHPDCKLVIHRRGAERMQTSPDYPAIAEQVVALDARLGDINHLEVGGIGVVAVGTTHLGVPRDRFDFATNLIFATTLGSVRFMHLGDTTLPYSAVDLARYPFAERPIDVLFTEYFDLSELTSRTIAEVIKPDHLIAVHVPPASWEVDSRNFHEAFPHGTLFRNPLERRIFDCGIDLHGQRAPFFGLEPPTHAARLFARGIVSTDHLEHSAPAFSPQGDDVFWSLVRRPDEGLPKVILHSHRSDAGWTRPTVAPFSGQFDDDGPAFSPDGTRLYFASKRPRADEADTAERSDIWLVEREQGGWSTPRCLDLGSRFSPPQSVAMPSVTRDGAIYFVAFTGNGSGGFEICRARLADADDPPPERLGDSINHPGALNWTPWIAPDESFLLFSSNRPGSHDAGGDIYFARHQPDGSWETPILLDDSVNTPAQERFPAVSPDGRLLFFTRWTREHDHDVFVTETERMAALNPGLNTR